MPQTTEPHDTELPAPPAIGHASLTIGADAWDLFVFGATRVGHDTFYVFRDVDRQINIAARRLPADGDASKQVREIDVP
jgi:hypothetical protein